MFVSNSGISVQNFKIRKYIQVIDQNVTHPLPYENQENCKDKAQ